MTELISMLEALRVIQMRDMQHKNTAECMMSLNEEVGELAREIKIEDKHYGNAHKQPGADGSIGEAIDVVIMGLALYYMRHALAFGPGPVAATNELPARMAVKLEKWATSQQIPFKEQHATDVQQEEKAGAQAVPDRVQGPVPQSVPAASWANPERHA